MQLSPPSPAMHSSHLLPVNPLLQVQSPLLSQLIEVEPLGLHLQSELQDCEYVQHKLTFQKIRAKQTFAVWIVKGRFAADSTFVTFNKIIA